MVPLKIEFGTYNKVEFNITMISIGDLLSATVVIGFTNSSGFKSPAQVITSELKIFLHSHGVIIASCGQAWRYPKSWIIHMIKTSMAEIQKNKQAKIN